MRNRGAGAACCSRAAGRRVTAAGRGARRVVLMRGSSREVDLLKESGQGRDLDRAREEGAKSEAQEALRQARARARRWPCARRV